jgi:hypothetical protein
MNFPEKD